MGKNLTGDTVTGKACRGNSIVKYHIINVDLMTALNSVPCWPNQGMHGIVGLGMVGRGRRGCRPAAAAAELLEGKCRLLVPG